MDNDKVKIRREPILLDKNTVALIHIFERYDELEDVMLLNDLPKYMQESYEQYKRSAQQFISQLKDNWTVLFMENLVEEAFLTMVEENGSAFTEKEAEKLINRLKEINDKR